MPDNYFVTGANGSQVNIGSWVDAEKGPDFGLTGLRKRALTSNPAVDGARNAFQNMGARQMTFPLVVPSVGALGGLHGAESWLQMLAQPGGYIDLLLDGVATAEAVRFDVLGGAWEPAYNVREHAVDRRRGNYILDVQPLGYWPTWIVLASTASMAIPGSLAVPGANVIGDAPGLAQLLVAPTNPATNFAAGTWLPDVLLWSLGGRASFTDFWPPASIGSTIAGALIADAVAPASQALRIDPSPTQSGWTQIAWITIASGLEPAHRGRHRAFAWLRVAPSHAAPWLFAADVAPALAPNLALASAAPVATVGAPRMTATDGITPGPSNAYQLLDLGEIALPPVGSGIQQAAIIRLWAAPGTQNAGIAAPQLHVGGLWLHNLEGPAGILARGLAAPSVSNPTGARFHLNAQTRQALAAMPTALLASSLPLSDLLAHYRGVFPMVSPTTNWLDVLVASRQRRSSYEGEVLADVPLVWYRLGDASGAATACDSSPFARHAPATLMGFGGAGLLPGASNLSASQVGSGYVYRSDGLGLPAGNAPRTVEGWVRIPTFAAGSAMAVAVYGDVSASSRAFGMYLAGTALIAYSPVNERAFAATVGDNRTHHLALTYTGTLITAYMDGEIIGTNTFVGTPTTTATALAVGRLPNLAAHGFGGGLDEISLYASALDPERVRAHYQAGRRIFNGPDEVPVRSAVTFAHTAVLYRPQFHFAKGL